MWGLIKTLFLLGLVAGLAYFVFYVDLGGATLAQHCRDVWRSAVVQQKVDKVRQGVRDELTQKVTRAPAGKPAAPAATGKGEQISDSDRDALNRLLAKSLK